jgi:hypothetical protein
VKRRHAQHAISEDDQIGRYAYALGHVPANIADRAYASAFARLPWMHRQEILSELGSQLEVEHQGPLSDDPEAFAAVMRDLRATPATPIESR